MRLTTVALSWVWLSGACGDDPQGGDVAADAADVADSTTDASDATPTDATPTDAVTTTDASEDVDTTGPIVCGDFAVEGELVANDAPGAFTLGGGRDLGFGGPLPDAVVLEFYSNATGTFELGVGDNDNYATCDQCVRIVQDIDTAHPANTRHFFQASGTMIIDPTTEPDSGRLKVQLVDMNMVEVKIFADFHTEPINRGDCYVHAGSVALETAACVPACGDHVCGPDGCGGHCGESDQGELGCATGVCALDGMKCTPEPECFTLRLPGGDVLDNTAAGVYRVDISDQGLAALGDKDFLQLEFYTRATGTFDLATTENSNYATCKQCVRVVLDGKREMFQAGGSLEIFAGSEPIGDPDATPPSGALTADLQNVRLVEVTYEDETYDTHVVEGGVCIDLVFEEPLGKKK